MVKKAGGYFGFFTVLAGMMLLGCGDDSNPGGPAVTKESLVGRWNLTSARLIGTATLDLPDPLPDTTYQIDSTRNFTGNDDYAQYDSAMTYRVQINEIGLGLLGSSTGTWSITGNQVTMIPQGGGDTTVLGVTVNGSSGTFVEPRDSIQVGIWKLPFNGNLLYFATKQ